MNEKTVDICSRCQQRFVRSPHSGDYVHDCFGIQALSNEDILVIGNWEDYSGSDSNVPKNVINAIQPNKLQGTRAGIEGSKEPGARTSRGFPKSRFRTRPHREYISEDRFKHQGITPDSQPEQYVD